ncbi:shikimate kinase [Dehalococcoides mccartyi]|uniref:Shikimate kinase n=1 Tax=Dehalococcoides mccartyi (strain VS) TaxID=311424 RepID=D2BGW2_DEHMV|nr:shikimate kinase [Dehalococcoides mccartyi]ACZ61562.1 shikimate kinase [Dehalococcoides mccartyi VS]
MKTKNNIALIGFMGAGKTSVSKLLSEKLGKTLVSTDTCIETCEGLSISSIFKEKGEEYFRQMESRVLEDVCRQPNQIIDCGGGIVTRPQNLSIMRLNCLVIYLESRPEDLEARLKNHTNRPLYNAERSDKMIKLLESRQPLYRDAADITVSTHNKLCHEVCEEIENRLRKYENTSG